MYAAFIAPAENTTAAASLTSSTFDSGLKWVVGMAILAGFFCIGYSLYYWKNIANRNTDDLTKCRRWLVTGIFFCLISAGSYAMFLYLKALGYF